MKLLLLLALSISAGAQSYSIDSVIDNLIQTESGGRIKAIGDNGRAEGILQMWKIAVDNANAISIKKGYSYRFTYSDRLDPVKSKLMCKITLIEMIERYKINKGRLPNEYELAHTWKWPYQYRIFDFKYINDYKTKKGI